jgi:hypothetical protein
MPRARWESPLTSTPGNFPTTSLNQCRHAAPLRLYAFADVVHDVGVLVRQEYCGSVDAKSAATRQLNQGGEHCAHSSKGERNCTTDLAKRNVHAIKSKWNAT